MCRSNCMHTWPISYTTFRIEPAELITLALLSKQHMFMLAIQKENMSHSQFHATTPTLLSIIKMITVRTYNFIVHHHSILSYFLMEYVIIIIVPVFKMCLWLARVVLLWYDAWRVYILLDFYTRTQKLTPSQFYMLLFRVLKGVLA